MIDAERLAYERLRGTREAKRTPCRAAKSAQRRATSARINGPDYRATAKAYAEGVVSTLTAQSRCLRCGKTLTDETSIARQIGGDCLEKVGGDEGWEHYRAALGLGGAS